MILGLRPIGHACRTAVALQSNTPHRKHPECRATATCARAYAHGRACGSRYGQFLDGPWALPNAFPVSAAVQDPSASASCSMLCGNSRRASAQPPPLPGLRLRPRVMRPYLLLRPVGCCTAQSMPSRGLAWIDLSGTQFWQINGQRLIKGLERQHPAFQDEVVPPRSLPASFDRPGPNNLPESCSHFESQQSA